MPLLARIEQDHGDERGAERFRLRLNSGAGFDAPRADGVTVLDLSTGGFLIETDASLDVGASISFTLPVTGEVTGEIVWASGAYFGGRFERPVPPAAISAALAASRVVWPNFAPGSADDRQSAAAPPAPSSGDAAARLPLPTRLRVIAGASLLLWSLIGGAGWLTVQALA